MGMFGGVYVYRVRNKETCCNKDDNKAVILPLTIPSVPCCPAKIDGTNNDHEQIWKRRVEWCTVFYVLIISGLMCAKYYQKYLGGFNNWYMKNLLNGMGLGETIFQYALLPLLVTMTIGLCLDGNRSFTSKITRLQIFRCVGRMSFQLFVIQNSIFSSLIVYRSAIPPHLFNTVFLVLPPLLAHVIRKSFDEPIQELLKC